MTDERVTVEITEEDVNTRGLKLIGLPGNYVEIEVSTEGGSGPTFVTVDHGEIAGLIEALRRFQVEVS